MMAQRVSSLTYRFGKRLNWRNTWSSKKSNVAICSTRSKDRLKLTNIIVNSLGLRTDNSIIRLSSDSFSTQLKSFQSYHIDNLLEVAEAGKSYLSSNCELNIRDTSTLLKQDKSLLNLERLSILHNREKWMNQYNQVMLLPFVSATLLSSYISSQIMSSERHKSIHFRRSLLSGIIHLLSVLIKSSKTLGVSTILGLKVQCNGKWKQTSSGRKQKLSFLIGTIKSQSIHQVMLLSSSNVNTKYGSCCLTIWISLRSI